MYYYILLYIIIYYYILLYVIIYCYILLYIIIYYYILLYIIIIYCYYILLYTITPADSALYGLPFYNIITLLYNIITLYNIKFWCIIPRSGYLALFKGPQAHHLQLILTRTDLFFGPYFWYSKKALKNHLPDPFLAPKMVPKTTKNQ